MSRKFLKSALVFITLNFCTDIASAQILEKNQSSGAVNQSVALPDPLTSEAVRQLVSTLSDQQVRSLLLERLDAVAKEKTTDNPTSSVDSFTLFESSVGYIGSSIQAAVIRIPRIIEGFRTSISNFYQKHNSRSIITLITTMMISIGAGLMGELVVNWLIRSKRSAIRNIDIERTFALKQNMKIMANRLFWDMIALIVFFMVMRAVAKTIIPKEFLSLSTLFMKDLIVLPRLTWALSRFLNAPGHPELRMVNATDEVARFFHRNMVGISIFLGLSTFVIEFHSMNGVQPGQTHLGFWFNALLFLWFGICTVVAREGITQILVGANPEEVTPTERRVAYMYPWFMAAFVLFFWCVVEVIAGMRRFDLLDGRQYVVLALVGFTPAMDTVIRGLVRHLFPPMQGEGVVARRAYCSTKRSYIRIGRILLFGLILLIISGLWDIDFENMATAGVGARFANDFLEVLMILAFGYLAWEVVTLLINKRLAAEMTSAGFDLEADEPGGGEGGGTGGSRLSTVLPMTRFTLQVAIVIMTILIAFSNMGIDVTPLLAGAGILGIAIGFGAQTLVKDVVSGVFFLLEDAFRVGEYLQISDIVGTVEKISLRSLQLRHHNGPVHTIPFGEITKVTNNSRDWVIMKLKWTLPFGTDINKIKKLFKEVGKEMMEAEYADNIIQTFKSQGVYDVDDVGVVIRGKFMARPGTQWLMRKDVFARVQKKLEENGIEFARREVRVNVPGLDAANGIDANDKQAISAAAAQAAHLAQQQIPKKEMPDTP